MHKRGTYLGASGLAGLLVRTMGLEARLKAAVPPKRARVAAAVSLHPTKGWRGPARLVKRVTNRRAKRRGE